jgi:hypothetical protein
MSKIELFDYQKEAVEQILHRSGVCLCFATGNGKSLVAVTATQELLKRHEWLDIIVVAPLSLLSNFKTSLSRYGVGRNHPAYSYYTYEALAKAYRYNDSILDGKVVVFDEVHHLRTSVYDALRTKVDKYRLFTHDTIHNVRRALKQASRMDICDPIAWVKRETGTDITPCAPKSLLMINATLRAFKVVCLTATPFFNSAYDVANVVSMMRRDGGVYSRAFFTNMLKDHALFSRHMKGLFLFKEVDKDDPDFPRVIHHEINLCMSPEYYKAYHEIELEVSERTRETNLQNPWFGMCF